MRSSQLNSGTIYAQESMLRMHPASKSVLPRRPALGLYRPIPFTVWMEARQALQVRTSQLKELA